jgi:hypothetical protein
MEREKRELSSVTELKKEPVIEQMRMEREEEGNEEEEGRKRMQK